MCSGSTEAPLSLQARCYTLIAAINARDPYTVWDGVDGADNSAQCDHNTWSANRFDTVNQKCVTEHGGTGRVIDPPPPAAAAARSAFTAPRSGDRMLRRGDPNGSGAY